MISTIWSCLAAHAAVLHLDCVERVPLREKCVGIFDCDKLADHPLTANLPPRLAIPHSRWNEY
jgi:homoserine O-succinyltransferase